MLATLARDAGPLSTDMRCPFTCGPAVGAILEPNQNIYTWELAAILRSPELKAAILKSLETDLERYVAAPQARSDFILDNASMAMHSLASKHLAADVAARASAHPPLIALVADAKDRFLKEAPSVMARQGLASCLLVACRFYDKEPVVATHQTPAPRQQSQALLSPQDMLGVITSAAAVMSSLLHDYPSPSPHDQSDLRMGLAGCTNLLHFQSDRILADPSEDTIAAPTLDFSRPGELRAALTALEAIARLAAYLPEIMPSDPPGYEPFSVERMHMLCIIAAWVSDALGSVPYADTSSLMDQESIDRVPGLVESCVKLALVAMRPPSQVSAEYDAARLEFSNTMLMLTGCVVERVALLLLKPEPRTVLTPKAIK